MSTALLIIDLQNDYFPDGSLPLAGIEEAAARAAELLAAFRAAGRPVVHLQHLSIRPGSTFFLPDTHGAEIHAAVAPAGNEPVLRKHFPNGFRETGLQEILAAHGADRLLVCGAMSHLCIDTTVRAAFDLGLRVSVAHDACATRDLRFGERTVAAADVHASFMAALAAPFARVATTAELLQALG